MDITRVAAISPITRVNAFKRNETRANDKKREEEKKSKEFEKALKLKQ